MPARHDNSFDALRLIGAVFVIVGHAYVLLGRLGEWPQVLGIDIHVLGVSLFFVISGYLIWGSWHRNRALVDYFSARLLRLLPALFLVILVTTFLLGPLVTTLSLGQYLASGETWNYLRNLYLFQPQYELPGVFETLPYPNVVNGSLWTLRAEFAVYVLVPLIGLLPRVLRAPALALFTVASALVGLASTVEIGGSNLSAAAAMWAFFGVGALARMIRETGLQIFRPWFAAAVAALWWLAYAAVPQLGDAYAFVALPYIVLTIGTWSLPVVRRAARFGDLSYGMYLWAFPIQQLLIQYVGWSSVWLNILVVTVLSALLALPTWHLIEKRALAMRFRPGNWLRARTARPL